MWSDGRDLDHDGTPVVLFQPVQCTSKKITTKKGKVISSQFLNQEPTSCSVGGRPSFYAEDKEKLRSFLVVQPAQKDEDEQWLLPNPRCTICNDELFLLMQMYAPLGDLDRTLYVFGCNRASCGNKLGSFCCLRSQVAKQKEKSEKMQNILCPTRTEVTSNRLQDQSVGQPEISKEVENSWTWSDDGHDDSNDQMGIGLDDIDTMLSRYEAGEGAKKELRAKKEKKKNLKANVDKSALTLYFEERNKNLMHALPEIVSSFTRRELEWFDEPCGAVGIGDDDEDCLGMTSKDDKALERMMFKYLEEEDDVDLLSSLRNAGFSRNVSSRDREDERNAYGHSEEGFWGERDESLPGSVKAFLSFTDRMKRAPMQVARYAYGGDPMWSAPPPSSFKSSRQRDQDGIYIPSCCCGARREFEFQLMPSLLHILNVDKKIPFCGDDATVPPSNRENIGGDGDIEGGMNWGVVAIYSCSESCDGSREEFVIVQDAMDGGLNSQK